MQDSPPGQTPRDEHRRVVRALLPLLHLQADENILEVRCSAGEISCALAEHVPEGRVVGLDPSDESVRAARKYNSQVAPEVDNAIFVLGDAGEIPWEANFFTRALSFENACIWPDPAGGLREIFRVLREGGWLGILLSTWREDTPSRHGGESLPASAHLLSAEEWAALFREAGFDNVAHRRIADPVLRAYFSANRPFPGSFAGEEQAEAFMPEGTLMVHGAKPVLREGWEGP